MTTTIDHEIGNAAKCLKAGYPRIALVAGTVEKAEKLRAAVLASFGEATAANVLCFRPDAFIAHLHALPRTTPIASAETVARRSRGGRKVKAARVAVAPEEARAREADALKILAETMRRKKRGAPGDSP